MDLSKALISLGAAILALGLLLKYTPFLIVSLILTLVIKDSVTNNFPAWAV